MIIREVVEEHKHFQDGYRDHANQITVYTNIGEVVILMQSDSLEDYNQLISAMIPWPVSEYRSAHKPHQPKPGKMIFKGRTPWKICDS